MMTLPDFRRLCVEYGEARHKYQVEPYNLMLREICDDLFKKVIDAEKALLPLLEKQTR